MIEGHKGSIICLQCMQKALENLAQHAGEFKCELCQQEQLPQETPRWHSPDSDVVACKGCISQAAGTFSKDPDVDWKRK